jgi:hypothetical protein
MVTYCTLKGVPEANDVSHHFICDPLRGRIGLSIIPPGVVVAMLLDPVLMSMIPCGIMRATRRQIGLLGPRVCDSPLRAAFVISQNLLVHGFTASDPHQLPYTQKRSGYHLDQQNHSRP